MDLKDEIWPTPVGDKLLDIREKIKKKCFYFYKLKFFIKEYWKALDKAIKNNADSINNWQIWKNRQASRDNWNQKSLFDNEE